SRPATSSTTCSWAKVRTKKNSPMSERQICSSRQELYGRGGPREYTGESLQEVAFPLGGIGTGTVSLGGRGQLRDWEIFNRPGKGKDLPFTFFSIWARPEGGEPVARVAERRVLPPFIAAGGLRPGGGFGL